MAWILFRRGCDGVPGRPMCVFHSFEQDLLICPWGEECTAGGVALRCEYFHFLFISHSYRARSQMNTLYGGSEMAFASSISFAKPTFLCSHPQATGHVIIIDVFK